jgi:uncharacterized protein involved in outer membrane biogenesis
MRKALPIIGAIIGVLILLFIALVGYAIVNLNSIVQAHRTEILSRASAALDRRVEVGNIKASLGWGVMVDLKDVNIADDPDFSPHPFLTAGDIYVKVAFIPLLFRHIKVQQLLLNHPAVRIIRNRSGLLNISTIGRNSPHRAARGSPPANAATPPKSPGGMPAGNNPMEAAPRRSNSTALNAISIRTLRIDDGSVYYDDQQSGTPVKINDLDLKLTNFSTDSPFDVKLAMAVFGNEPNIALAGQAGPIAREGQLDIPATPLKLNVTVGPLSVAQMRAVAPLARLIPAQLSTSQPLSVKAKLGGTVQAASFDISSDLTQNHVIYQGQMDKPAGVPFVITADGKRERDRLILNHAEIILASLDMKASDITLGAGDLKARVDTNDFALAPLGKILTKAASYNPSGSAALHADIAIVNKRPSVVGELKLTRIALAFPSGGTPPVSDVSGVIKVNGNRANAGPLTFNLGSGHGTLEAAASSLQPLTASYDFKADTIKLAELVPSRKNLGERLNQFAAHGTLSGSIHDLHDLHATTDVTSPSGMVANVPYQNLALTAAYGANRVDINSLKLAAYSGTIDARGNAALSGDRRFDLTLNCNNLNVQQAMEAQKAKAAETVRGLLTGNVHVIGAGTNFAQIRPTLHGNGRAQVRNGKLVGVNVVAQALTKVDNLPGIGTLIPSSITRRHPELFSNPDTDIQNASLSFTLSGPRITSHDLNVQAADYTILGDGWFDMDKNIDLTARILLSRAFSDEIVAARKNVAFLTNQDRQVEVPLRISGKLPKPLIAPDVAVLARRAASHALQNRLGGLIEKKGLGGLLGGSSGSSNPLHRFFR